MVEPPLRDGELMTERDPSQTFDDEGSSRDGAAMALPSDPMPYIIAAGLVVTLLLHGGLKGNRGLFWSALTGVSLPLAVWLCAVASVLVYDGGTSDSSRFTIGAGLVIGVGLSVVFYSVGALAAAILVLVARAAIDKRPAKVRRPPGRDSGEVRYRAPGPRSAMQQRRKGGSRPFADL